MKMKRNNMNLVIVHHAPSTATTLSIRDAALELAVTTDPLEHLETLARPTYLVLSDSPLPLLTGEGGVRLVCEDRRNSG